MHIILYNNNNSKNIFFLEENNFDNFKIELNYCLFYNFKLIEKNNVDFMNNLYNNYFFICDIKKRIKICFNYVEYLIPYLMNVSEFIMCYNKNYNITIKNKFNNELFLDDYFSENENYFCYGS